MRYFVLIFLALTCLSACGGGGSSDQPNNNGTGGEDLNVAQSLRLVFLGDSLTDGYTLPISQAYPSLIQEKIAALGLPHLVTNSGRSGDTSEDALRRLDRELGAPIDVLILALGTNDVEDGLGADQVEANLQQIIDRTKEVNPDLKVVIAGAYVPRIFSTAAKDSYRLMFQSLAQKNNAAFLENMLESVEGNAGYNLPDLVHPNAAGHQLIAENFWPVLAPLVGDGAALSGK